MLESMEKAVIAIVEEMKVGERMKREFFAGLSTGKFEVWGDQRWNAVSLEMRAHMLLGGQVWLMTAQRLIRESDVAMARTPDLLTSIVYRHVEMMFAEFHAGVQKQCPNYPRPERPKSRAVMLAEAALHSCLKDDGSPRVNFDDFVTTEVNKAIADGDVAPEFVLGGEG